MDCSNYSTNETNNQENLGWEFAIDIVVVMVLGYLTTCQLVIFVRKKEYKLKSYRISDLSNQSFCLKLSVIIADSIGIVVVLLSLSSYFFFFYFSIIYFLDCAGSIFVFYYIFCFMATSKYISYRQNV